MKILVLTSRIPYPPNRGDRLRVFNFIRGLSDDHEIHLVSFIENNAQCKRTEDLQKYCVTIQTRTMSKLGSFFNVLVNFWRRYPLQALYYRSRQMQKLVDGILKTEKFDLVYIHLFRMAPYLEKWDQIYRIVDLTDVVSKEMELSIPYRNGISRLIYSVEKDRVRHYEQEIVKKFDESWLISKADSVIMEKVVDGAKIRIVRNGVDSATFYPLDDFARNDHQLIFVGHMSVPHNVDAAIFLAEQIFPDVRSEYPDASLVLAGAHPNPKVESLGRLERVRVTGFVDDLNLILNESAIFVAPLRFAAGVQNKVLEACAAGIPVITSKMVGEGIGLTEDIDVLYAENETGFVRQIRKLLDDPALGSKLARNAREFVLEHYNWELVKQQVEKIQSDLEQYNLGSSE